MDDDDFPQGGPADAPPERAAGTPGTLFNLLDTGLLDQLEAQDAGDLPLQQAQAPVLLRLLLTMFLDANPSSDIEHHGRSVLTEEIDRQSAMMDIRMQQSMIRRAKFRSLN